MIENLMKNYLVSDSNCQHCKPIIPQKKLQGMPIKVGLTFSVGGTTQWFTISIE
jgi:hypothetical protein